MIWQIVIGWRRNIVDGVAMLALASSADLFGRVLWPAPEGVAAGTAWGYFMGYYAIYAIDRRWNIYTDRQLRWHPFQALVLGTVLGLASGYMPFSPSTRLLTVLLPLFILWGSLAVATALIGKVEGRLDWRDQALTFPLGFIAILFWQLSGMIVAAVFSLPPDLRSGLLTAILAGPIFGFPVDFWFMHHHTTGTGLEPASVAAGGRDCSAS